MAIDELKRSSGRSPLQLRPIRFRRRFTDQAPGSVLVEMGRTWVLCTCHVENSVPPFLVDSGKGWLTAEYAMLPGSTPSRKARDRSGKIDGRSVEIQRLIGRSLRAVVDLTRFPEHTLWIDCDVLQADGGTRTASINGAFVALVDALWMHKQTFGPPKEIIHDSVAAVSLGIIGETVYLDLDYEEDVAAEVDLNLVMTGKGRIIEVQGTGEEHTFSRHQLDQMLKLGTEGIQAITAAQRKALGRHWPLD